MALTRRELLASGAAVAATGSARRLGVRPGAPAGAESPRLAALRERAKRRRRGVIYNSDGDDLSAPAADTPDGLIHQRLAWLRGTAARTVAQSAGGTTMYMFATPT